MLQAINSVITTLVPSARDRGRLRLGFFTSPAAKVTLFQASAAKSDPTWAIARMVNVFTNTVGPPTPTCTACCALQFAPCQNLPWKFATRPGVLRLTKNPSRAKADNAEILAKVNTF